MPSASSPATVAVADPEDEAATGDLVDGDGPVAEEGGVAIVEVGDARAHGNSAGGRGDGQGGGHAVVDAGSRLDHEHPVEARVFRAAAQIHGVALAGGA